MTSSLEIQAMHDAYCRATGFDLPMTFDRESAWYWWVKKGFGAADVLMLIRHYQSLAKKGDKRARSLTFRNLVGNVDWAEEDLVELRARFRGPSPRPNKEAVLKQTGRGPAEALPQDEPQASREVVNKLLADFRKSLDTP